MLFFWIIWSEVALEEPEIGSTDANIPIVNNSTEDILNVQMPGGSGDYYDEVDESNDHDSFPAAILQYQVAMDLESFDMASSDVDRYEGNDANDPDEDDEEESLQPDDGSTQNVEDWRHSSTECEDWTVYFSPVKYDNGEADGLASKVSEAKTVLQYVAKS